MHSLLVELSQLVDIEENGVNEVGAFSLRQQVAVQGHHVALCIDIASCQEYSINWL